MDQAVSSQLEDDVASEHRVALRKKVRLRADLRDRTSSRLEIEVIDFSVTGFRAESAFTLWPGTVVWLSLPGRAPVEAVVAWRDRYHYACAFVKPLDQATFDHVVSLSGV